MASVGVRNEKLYLDFMYQKVRCREHTQLSNNLVNERKLQKLLKKIDADIRLGCFVYRDYFPDSPRVVKFIKQDNAAELKKEEMLGHYKNAVQQVQGRGCITFEDFTEEWYAENESRWKESYKESMRIYLYSYLVPHFGEKEMDRIERHELLKFRAEIAKPRDNGKKLSAEFINHVMTPLRMMLSEAGDRFGFRTPFENIKALRIDRRDVQPFDLDEVMYFLQHIRLDFKNYFTVRFFTGMRTSEIDGLKWQYVDFKRRTVSVRETFVHGRMDTAKTIGSARDIQMTSSVYEALQAQFRETGNNEFVFCNKAGNPLDKKNVRDRVWKPALIEMGMKYRRPYETRHTYATLMLAAGEAPEWIARQMGHTTTKMLFQTYSRFVPNLTRNDGSAFEKLLKDNELD
ncbi:site-specific integrase [Vibrio sp. SS-MA-C1-2]|uniref:tyrosine-type recombinase/integrase n=1 Tax=Vibrio sp. SS-MA-C1-2 TaxID=2908646 RepID=UPI001F354B61|nr:tyrosine-type recombinase/integrase [Vibrio sp. SS-MA-C1-2]UJF17101.1 site-specific integrase [Vibrio sp. SS-MA-C1-2]